ncbi:MAG: hypothetical protein M0Q91_18525 [Methanoregula sp.]|nr:hypothetical protein [Methanoregula sp.]
MEGAKVMNGKAAFGWLLMCSGIGLMFITFLAATYVTSPLSISGWALPVCMGSTVFGLFLITTSGDTS